MPATDAAPAALPPPRRIVLTGFMGAGKTTVGQLLAKRLHWRFQDVDAAIEAAAGSTVARLFETHGEAWFRQLERQTVRELLEFSSIVLALGGGAIEDPGTRQLIHAVPTTRLIHLEASLATVLERCHGTESVRPVLRDRLKLEDRYNRRLPLYRQAHLTVAVDSLTAQEAAEAVLEALTTG